MAEQTKCDTCGGELLNGFYQHRQACPFAAQYTDKGRPFFREEDVSDEQAKHTPSLAARRAANAAAEGKEGAK